MEVKQPPLPGFETHVVVGGKPLLPGTLFEAEVVRVSLGLVDVVLTISVVQSSNGVTGEGRSETAQGTP